jgi:hypothetical protein
MILDRSYIGYLGFLGIDLFKSVLMYSNGAICLIKLLFKMGLFTVYRRLSPQFKFSLSAAALGINLYDWLLNTRNGTLVTPSLTPIAKKRGMQ